MKAAVLYEVETPLAIEELTLLPPKEGCVLDTFFCLGWFGLYRRLWPHNTIHFSEVH